MSEQVRRLAEQQQPMTGFPIDTDWAQEVQSYWTKTVSLPRRAECHDQ